MTERHNEDVLRSLTGVFAERVKRSPLGEGSGMGDALASVRTLERRRGQLPRAGGGALLPTPGSPRRRDGFRVPSARGEHPRPLRPDAPSSPPVDDEPWVEAGPGASWLELEDELRVRGRGLAVYPRAP